MAQEQLCTNCFQGVTNPICEKCHTKQLALWLNDSGFHHKTIRYIVSRIRKDLESEGTNESLCILCSRDLISLCTFCYFFKVDEVLRELDLPGEMIEEFLETFNYKLYKGRYSI